MDELDLIQVVHGARLSLTGAVSVVNRGDHAQFVHLYERVPGEKYRVQHKREGCEFCDAIDAVFEALAKVEEYAFETARAKQ